MDEIERIKEIAGKAIAGPLGFYGSDVPKQGTLESGAGISVGSTTHTEPVARFSGYLMDAKANAEFYIALANAWPSLLGRIEAGERLAEAVRSFTGVTSPNIRDALAAFAAAKESKHAGGAK